MSTVNDGATLIAAERRRQIEAEGWTADHDDSHDTCELVQAAVCYLHVSTQYEIGGEAPPWPWGDEWWKPRQGTAGYIRNLTKAGALIAAEIDRLQRLAARAKEDARHD